MSESTDAFTRAISNGQRTRHRQYRIAARVLKEYTNRLNRLAFHIGEFDDGRIPMAPTDDTPLWSVFRAVHRVNAIKNQVEEMALFASQMLVHYALDEAEVIELKIRIADAENAVFGAQHVADSFREKHIDKVSSNAEVKNGERTPRRTKPQKA